jgi:hypothetical protein
MVAGGAYASPPATYGVNDLIRAFDQETFTTETKSRPKDAWFELRPLPSSNSRKSDFEIASRYAYALRFNPENLNEQYLAIFDTGKDALVKEIKLPADSGFNNFAVDEVGGCYISKYRTSFDYGEEIYYYNPKTEKIELYYKFRDIFGPRYLIVTKNHLIVFVYGNRKTRIKNGIVFINRKTKNIDKQIFFKENEPQSVQFSIRNFFFDRKNNLISFTTAYDEFVERPKRLISNYKFVYLVDSFSMRVVKSIKILSETRYARFEGICMVDNLLYVAPNFIERYPGDDFFSKKCINRDILLVSQKGEILKKIKTLDEPDGMVYDPLTGKLFVWAQNYKPSGIKIVDTKANIVIGELPEVRHIFMASLVAPGKLYVTTSDYKGKNAIVFFDTKTNRVLGSVPGVYTGISR